LRRRSLLYLDASAIVKLVSVERESAALRTAVARSRLVASELILVEVSRALGRLPDASERARLRREEQRVLAGLDLVPLTRLLLTSAGKLGPPRLRALDAVHIASALTLGSGLEFFVTYDRR
jgi:predicted nucleic acid-binding protein